MEHCPNCGGELKIIAVILEQPVIEKIFTHLGLQARHRLVHRPVAKRLKRPDDSGSQPCRRGSAGREGYWDRWMRSGAKGQPADSVREGRFQPASKRRVKRFRPLFCRARGAIGKEKGV